MRSIPAFLAVTVVACSEPTVEDRLPVDAPIHRMSVVESTGRNAPLVIALRYGLSDSCHDAGGVTAERSDGRILVTAISLRLSDPTVGCRHIYGLVDDTVTVPPPFPTTVVLEPVNPVDDAAAIVVTFP